MAFFTPYDVHAEANPGNDSMTHNRHVFTTKEPNQMNEHAI